LDVIEKEGLSLPPSPEFQAMTERSLFLEALEITDPAERSAYLDRACAADPQLRDRVAQLLKAHDKPGRFMERPALALVASAEGPVSERPGTVIGPYKLLEQIGEGGFGVVFMAEQHEPVRRKVALKVIKPGMDTRQVVARFEAERQALALMDHPHIAHILDAGQTASGRPYFVMELVRGTPITDFCDQSHLSVRQRLELFINVCQAVQHAHQKGIIHRDLKPTNVLVTLHDTVPVVKVIDFGIAKATGRQLTDKTLFTNFAQMIGTPMYMSPEQAQLSGLDIDTRTDIYTLGVLLYELLTGTTPFDRERLRTAAYDEIRRIIREEEPPRPSTRISTLGRAAQTVSANRQSDFKRLRQQFRGELDWIVMKALEKDRNRRYETVSALAADVQRFLNDEPVQACPPSWWYRFRKLARRNKRAFVMASALALAVLLGVIGLAASNILIRQEQARTQEEKERAEKAQQLAQQRAEEIRRGLERLKTANALLDRGRYYTDEMRWDDAHASLAKAVQLRPDHASVWAELSEMHARLGLWELASADFARELELREPDSTMRWYRHALLRLHLGDVAGYRQVSRRMRRRFRGTSNMQFITEVVRTCALNPGPDADLGHLVESAQGPVDHEPRSWFHPYVLGIAHYRAGQYPQAVRRLRASLVGYPNWSLRALSYPVLAMAHHRLGQATEARQALGEAARAIDRWTQEMYQRPGERHWVSHLGAVGHWPIAWWDWLECRFYYREAKVLIDGSPPPEDPRVRILRARSFAGLRWHTKAESEYAAALKRLPHDPQIRLEAHRNRAYGSLHLRRWKQAAAAFARAGELQPDDAYLGLFRAVSHLAAGERGAYRQTCAALVQRFEKTGTLVAACNVVLACVLRDDTFPDMTRLLPLARFAAAHFHFGSYVFGAALYRAGKYHEAVRCFEAAAKTYRPRAWNWCFLAMAHHRLGHARQARRCLAQAARWIDQANREELDDLTGNRTAWGDWHEQVYFPLLLREAEKLLKQDSGLRGRTTSKSRPGS
jgi:serine/threonine protein kinase/Flp pilus assembly protein TadD